MARIVYAAAGEGLGHATRAHSVGLGLLARGHEVHFLASRRATEYLRQVFPDRLTDIFGMHCAYRGGRLSPFWTVCENVAGGLRNLWPTRRAIRAFYRTWRPDLLVCDFEPFSAYFARRTGLPFVTLDNQHLLTHFSLDLPPGHLMDWLSAWTTIRCYCGGAKRYLVTTYIEAPAKNPRGRLVPPVLRPLVYSEPARQGNYLLVYNSLGVASAPLIEAPLRAFDRMPIIAYGFEREGHEGHMTFKLPSVDGFLKDLAGCAGVLASAGHSLVCEALHFRKPMLIMPLPGQYEQWVNAHYIRTMGLGMTTDTLTVAELEHFASDLGRYRSALNARPQATIDPVLDAIEQEL